MATMATIVFLACRSALQGLARPARMMTMIKITTTIVSLHSYAAMLSYVSKHCYRDNWVFWKGFSIYFVETTFLRKMIMIQWYAPNCPSMSIYFATNPKPNFYLKTAWFPRKCAHFRQCPMCLGAASPAPSNPPGGVQHHHVPTGHAKQPRIFRAQVD